MKVTVVDAAAHEDIGAAEQRLRRLLAEFKLYGGFAGPDGRRIWANIQQAVREIDQLRVLHQQNGTT